MLFLLVPAVELAVEAAPAIAAAATEAAPVVEAAIASAEAALSGTAATAATATAATATAEAAAGTAAGTVAETGAAAATRSAASHLMSKAGEEAVVANVEKGVGSATTEAAMASHLMDKLAAWSTRAVATGVAMKGAIAVGVVGGTYALLHDKIAESASSSLELLHTHGQEKPEVDEHHKQAIEKFAHDAAHYGVASNLAKDTAQIIKEVRDENAALGDSVGEFRTAMTASSAVPGMEGMHGLIDKTTAQAESVRELTDVQSNMLGSAGQISAEQIQKARDVLDVARANYHDSPELSRDIKATDNLFAKLGRESNPQTPEAAAAYAATAKEALTLMEAVRHDMRMETANNGQQVADKLKVIGDKHAEDMKATIKELMPAIAQVNAKAIVDNLERQAEAAKAREASAAPTQTPAPATHAQAQSHAQAQTQAQANVPPPPIGEFKAPPGFPTIGEMSR